MRGVCEAECWSRCLRRSEPGRERDADVDDVWWESCDDPAVSRIAEDEAAEFGMSMIVCAKESREIG